MKYIKEFFTFFDKKNRLKVGDKVRCIKDFKFNAKYGDLPRVWDYEKGEEFEVVEVDELSVKIKCDRGVDIFVMDKKDKDYFPYIFDYFEKID